MELLVCYILQRSHNGKERKWTRGTNERTMGIVTIYNLCSDKEKLYNDGSDCKHNLRI